MILSLVAATGQAAMATGASAERAVPGVWLANGAPVRERLYGSVAGMVLIEDPSSVAGPLAVLCDLRLAVLVGPGSGGEIDGFRAHTGGVRPTVSGPYGMPCESVRTCAGSTRSSPIEAWPVGLPWMMALHSTESGVLGLSLAAVRVGYGFVCLVLGLAVQDACTASSAEIQLLNDPITGDAEMLIESVATPREICSLSGRPSGIYEPDESLPITSGRSVNHGVARLTRRARAEQRPGSESSRSAYSPGPKPGEYARLHGFEHSPKPSRLATAVNSCWTLVAAVKTGCPSVMLLTLAYCPARADSSLNF